MCVKKTDATILNKQKQQWVDTYSKYPDMFGEAPSSAVMNAAKVFKDKGIKKVLELGGGHGRDTIFLAKNGFDVNVLDYSEKGIEIIRENAKIADVSENITAACHDIRTPLPFGNDTFDGCFSHMLFCMALSISELEFLSSEINRVLKPGGVNIYTARHTGDAHFGTGIHRGENMYEVNGFIVHFFSMELVEHLANDFELLKIEKFEEGELPKKLFLVILQKKG